MALGVCLRVLLRLTLAVIIVLAGPVAAHARGAPSAARGPELRRSSPNAGHLAGRDDPRAERLFSDAARFERTPGLPFAPPCTVFALVERCLEASPSPVTTADPIRPRRRRTLSMESDDPPRT